MKISYLILNDYYKDGDDLVKIVASENGIKATCRGKNFGKREEEMLKDFLKKLKEAQNE